MNNLENEILKKPYIIVVIPFKGRCELVVNCIRSIVESYINEFTYQFYLLDDGSSYDEIKSLKQIGDFINQCYYHRNKQNLGYTKSIYNLVENLKKNNRYSYMLLVNSDVMFAHINTFSSLVKRAISNPNISVVGCKILDWNKDIIIHTGTRIKNGKIIDPYCGLHQDDPSTNIVERRLWVNGCCALYNLRILREENMNFDLDFSPAYFEESDIMTRLNLKGYSILYEPNAVVRHMLNATNKLETEKYRYAFAKNWKLYLNKWEKYFNSNMLYFQ